jgi:double-stranded uracil-DNA glycosylase
VSRGRVALSVGFPPIADAAARVLVLGSLPGRKSLEMREYYAQPYNAFWRIMGELNGAGPTLEYPARLVRLRAHGVAVWDVLAAGEREGSLDSAIVPTSIVVNDFNAFFERHRRIRLICFNGNTAAGLFRRKVFPGLAPEWAAIERHALPSTSPAYASLKFEQKLARWAAVLGRPQAGSAR